MPAKKYATPEEAYTARLQQNARWRRDNLDVARDASTRWHEEQRGLGNNPNADTFRDPALLMLGKAKQRAKSGGLPYELDKAWLRIALQPMLCSVTGLPLTFDKGHGFRSNPWCPSIDRKQPALGYTRDNSRIVCWAYNLAKSEWGDDVPLRLAEALMRTI